MIDFSKKISD